MLVPDFFVTPTAVPDLAAITNCPGADTSGLLRPSRVGPELEKEEIGKVGLCAS
jgi:hypothetical protein